MILALMAVILIPLALLILGQARKPPADSYLHQCIEREES